MERRIKKALAGTSAAMVGTAVLGIVHHYTAKYLVALAIGRKEPRSVTREKEKIMISREWSEMIASVTAAAKELEKCEHEQVEIVSQDGTVLIGHWFCAGNAKRVIVAMHGWRSKWSQDFGIIAPFWFDSNCSVLFAEQRGQGNSGGEYMGFGILERHDCLDWIRWVNERTEARLPIFLSGVSMGATTVLMATGLELPLNVRGIIADCAFTSPPAIWKHVAQENLHLPYGLYSKAAKEIYKKNIQASSDSYSTTEALQGCKIPVLFIHGTDDRLVPIEMTYENYKACASGKKLLVVPGAGHGMSYLIDKAGYEKAIRRLWNTC